MNAILIILIYVITVCKTKGHWDPTGQGSPNGVNKQSSRDAWTCDFGHLVGAQEKGRGESTHGVLNQSATLAPGH